MNDKPLPSGVTMLEELYIIEQIKKLKARYFRGVDTTDGALFQSTFADDVVIDFRGVTEDADGKPALPLVDSPEFFRGAKAWADQVMRCRAEDQLVTMHHGHMPEIDVLSPTTAKAIWSMEDIVYIGTPNATHKGFHAFGYYHETYEKIDGEWKIKTVRLTRLRVNVEPA